MLCRVHLFANYEVQHIEQFLGPFAKLRKATISCFMSVSLYVRPPVRIENLDSHWTDFHEI